MATKSKANLPATKSNTNIVDIKAQLKSQLAALSERIAPAAGSAIRVTQDKKFKFPDGTETPGPFRAVIVDFVTTRDYYEGNYDPNNISPPACFAISASNKDMVPSPNSPNPQAKTCATCPQNVFGSAGNGKACKESRKLALLPPDAAADEPIQTLKISPTALKSYDGYVASLGRMGAMPIEKVTEVGFDPNVSYASVRMANPEDNDQLGVHFARMQEAQELLMVEPDVSTYGQTKAAPARGRAPARGPARR